MDVVELIQIVLDIFYIADPSPSKESLVVIDTGVFTPRSVVVGNRQANENTIMLWIIRDVERMTVKGIGTFHTCALAEDEWWTFFSCFKGAVVPYNVSLSGRVVLERFSKKDGIDIKGWTPAYVLKASHGSYRNNLPAPLYQPALTIDNPFQFVQRVENRARLVSDL